MSESEVEVEAQSNELIAYPATKPGDEVPTVGVYRLYKRRWLGVFAMVGSTFFAWAFMLTLYSLCSRLWLPPVGHGLDPYPTTVRLFFLSHHGS